MMTRSILILDNEQTVRESLSIFLSGEGYACQLAKDGDEALKRVQSHSFDIILMDLHFPRQNGLAIFKRIKAHSPHPIYIILTTYYHIDESAPALQEGAATLLLKPIDFEELLDVINEQIALKQ